MVAVLAEYLSGAVATPEGTLTVLPIVHVAAPLIPDVFRQAGEIAGVIFLGLAAEEVDVDHDARVELVRARPEPVPAEDAGAGECAHHGNHEDGREDVEQTELQAHGSICHHDRLESRRRSLH